MIIYTEDGPIDSKTLNGTLPYFNVLLSDQEAAWGEKYIPDFNMRDVSVLYEKLSTHQPLYEKGLFMVYNHIEIGISLSLMIMIVGYLLIKK